MNTCQQVILKAIALTVFCLTLLMPLHIAYGQAGLVSHWSAEGNASDVNGGNNGTLLNSASFRTGVFGQASSFDGGNDFLHSPTTALPIGNTDRTVYNRAPSASKIQTLIVGVTPLDPCLLPFFQPARNFGVGSIPGRVAFDDFNLDGKPDMAVTSPDSRYVAVFIGDGTSDFSAPNILQAGFFSVPVATGDFNNDGKPDLAVGSGEGSVWIYLGDGTGGFAAATTFPTESGAYAYEIAVSDFNGDGKLDLAIANQFGGLAVLLGHGTGSFSPPTIYAVGADPTGVSAVDINNDGKIDLVTSNTGSSDVSVLLGDGSGNFSAATNFAVGSYPIGFAVGDFNHDTKIDLALSNFLANTVSVLLGNGMGGFNPPVNFPAGQYPNGIRASDFNGDGKLDLATPNVYSGVVSILLGDGTGGFGSPITFAAGSGIVGISIADLNLDGKPDIATPNYFDRNISVLINNGDNSLDTSPPVISIAVGMVDATGTGAYVSYAVSAFDNSGRVATLSCDVASGALFPIGTTPLTCTATDYCGNFGSQIFNITVKYGLNVLFDQTKAVKSGSTIPIKIQLVDGLGHNVSSAAVVVYAVSLVQIATTASETINDAGNSNPDSNFRFDSSLGGSGGYIFNLKTTGLSTGTYRLGFKVVGDPAIYTVQFAVRQ